MHACPTHRIERARMTKVSSLIEPHIAAAVPSAALNYAAMSLPVHIYRVLLQAA
jgi:hypothetical protein